MKEQVEYLQELHCNASRILELAADRRYVCRSIEVKCIEPFSRGSSLFLVMFGTPWTK